MVEDLRWTTPHSFDTDFNPLIRAITRYHAFLDIQQSSSKFSLVPTLDIDLVLHTHLLSHYKYREDSTRLLGQVLKHEDKVEENELANAFEETAKAWNRHFGVPLTTCGCVSGEASHTPFFKLNPLNSRR
ncbi:hypothetical protein BT69DRAFT_132293 [Atractiella rhizophila]|nr:hypothetical protein BT69DRAFT_132293 [Atractiella rhizophila]